MGPGAVAVFWTLVHIAASSTAQPPGNNGNHIKYEVNDFDWLNIKPSKKLIYHRCYGEHQCARLLMPLDWQAEHELLYNKTAAIAIIKRPATVSITDPTYAGPLITNPGGPGGSGVLFMLQAGTYLTSVVDNADKHFDLVSFDPRGVLNSDPPTKCFHDFFHSDLWSLRTLDDGLLRVDEGGNLAMQWARAKALGWTCNNAGVGDHISTTSVARDMLEIIDRIEEHHQLQLSERTHESEDNGDAQSPLSNARNGETSTAMLQYLGFSYGTYLGVMFASMFPSRIKRMVLDGPIGTGNMVFEDWTSLNDTDAIMDRFYFHCFNAGSRCALYDEKGPDAIEKTVHDMLEKVKREPVPVLDPGTLFGPSILTYSDLKRAMFACLYSPVILFPYLAEMLDEIRRGTYEKIGEILAVQTWIRCSDDAKISPWFPHITTAIMCSDNPDLSHETPAEFSHHFRKLKSHSSVAGAIWANFRLQAVGWGSRSNWRYEGPFSGNTSAPILWIGNSLDPVTPIGNAYNVAKKFPRSSVLEQDTEGHCALWSGPSSCTLGAVREYFRSGEVPKLGTKCPSERKPFDGLSSSFRLEKLLASSQFPLMPHW